MFKLADIALIVITILALSGCIGVLYYNYTQKSDYENQLQQLRLEIARQKADKDKIRSLWEQTASQNDKLVIAQENLNSQVNNYQAEIKRSIRFINTKPELLSTISEKNILNLEAQILTEQNNLEDLTQENTEIKQSAKDTIDSIYLQAGEEQNNRANPRTGVN
jgi:hypothetical protein